MTMFCCDACGCVDVLEYEHKDAVPLKRGQFLCAACRSRIVEGKEVKGEWHNSFPKRAYDPLQDHVVNRNPYGISLGD